MKILDGGNVARSIGQHWLQMGLLAGVNLPLRTSPFRDAGVELTLASPKGVCAAPIDPQERSTGGANSGDDAV